MLQRLYESLLPDVASSDSSEWTQSLPRDFFVQTFVDDIRAEYLVPLEIGVLVIRSVGTWNLVVLLYDCNFRCANRCACVAL